MDTSSNFCGLCERIQFDDAITGGCEAQDTDGNRVLSFVGDDDERYFDTGLEIQDTYPTFPFLSRSAAYNKCDGCIFLKASAANALSQIGDDIISDNVRIGIRAGYRWSWEVVDTPSDLRGIVALVLAFAIHDSQGLWTSLISALTYINSY